MISPGKKITRINISWNSVLKDPKLLQNVNAQGRVPHGSHKQTKLSGTTEKSTRPYFVEFVFEKSEITPKYKRTGSCTTRLSEGKQIISPDQKRRTRPYFVERVLERSKIPPNVNAPGRVPHGSQKQSKVMSPDAKNRTHPYFMERVFERSEMPPNGDVPFVL